MVNLAESNSDKMIEIEEILKRYRLTATPASNMDLDHRADPKHFAGNWVSWREPEVIEYYKYGNISKCIN